MKLNLLLCLAWLAPISLGATEVVVNSDNNSYQVHLVFGPPTLLYAPSDCQDLNGFTYSISFSYNIFFTGSNIPAKMDILQGRWNCNNFVELPDAGGNGTGLSEANYSHYNQCNSVSLASIGCTQFNIEIAGPNLSYRIIPISSQVLPISLMEFKIKGSGQSALLSWKSNESYPIQKYELQKSTDTKNWLTVNSIQPNSTVVNQNDQIRTYEYTDQLNSIKINYYRLKTIALDGSYNFSEIVHINPIQNRSALLVYPNPVIQTAVIEGTRANEIVAVYELSGKKVADFQTQDGLTKLDLESLNPGMYLLQYRHQVNKLVKN